MKGESQLRDECFTIEYTCMQCSECGHRLLSPEQMAAKVRATVEAYQKAYGLLTAKEMISKRKALGYRSQADFVAYAKGVSLPTLKRLEAGQRVQDESTDVLLRVAIQVLEQKKHRSGIHAILNEPLDVTENIDSRLPKRRTRQWKIFSNPSFPMAACLTVAVASQVSVPNFEPTDFSNMDEPCFSEGIPC